MNVTFDALVTVIKRSGLLATESIVAALQAYKDSTEDHTPRGFLDFLCDRQMLTKWQADKLYDGKHKGFFLGKYRLLTMLGRGGMSTVYLAEHVLMKRLCAVKVLPWKNVKGSSSLKRFHVEAQAAASLDHPNIVRAYDLDHEADGNAQIHFMVMEYVEGSNLYELVQNQGPLSPGKAANFVWQACQGLEHAHSLGMVHRDVKPGNLIVDKSGVVKVMDLGLARMMRPPEEGSLTEAHDERVLGTADYLSPEQAVDSHLVDSRADLYALGCTLYYLMVGKAPFPGGSLAQRILAHQSKTPPKMDPAKVPESMQKIVHKLMAKKPEKRFQSAQELADVLMNWLATNDPQMLPEDHRSSQRLKANSRQAAPEPVLTESRVQFQNFLNKLSQEDIPVLADSPSDKLKSAQSASAAERKGGPQVLAEAASTTSSGSGSLARGRRQRKQRQKFVLLTCLFAVFAVVGAYAWYINTSPKNPESAPETTGQSADDNGSGPEAVEDSPATASADAPQPLKPLTGNVINVGADGHFKELSAALKYVSAVSISGGAAPEIVIASGTKLSEAVTIDNSGLGGFPKGVKVRGEGPDWPVLSSSASGPLLTLNSVEGLSIENLQFDGSSRPTVISLEGYLPDTAFRAVTVKGIESVGISTAGASGLMRQPLSFVNCRFRSAKDTAVAMRLGGSAQGDTRQIVVENCQFLEPAQCGIEFTGTTWDITISRCIFNKQQTGVRFAASARDLNNIRFENNTWREGGRGIAFDQGPTQGSQRFLFVRNLFSGMTAGDVVKESNLPLEQLAANVSSPSRNWTDRTNPQADLEYDIFATDGSRGAVEFISLDTEHPDFLKPRSGSGAPGGNIGAVKRQ